MKSSNSPTVNENTKVSLSLILASCGIFGGLCSAWVSSKVAGSMIETEVANLKSGQAKKDEKIDQLVADVSEMKGMLKEMQRQDDRRDSHRR